MSRCSTVAEQRGALVKMFDSRRRVPGSIPEVGVFWHLSEFFVACLDFVPLLGCLSADFWVSWCLPATEQRGALVKMLNSRRRAPGSMPESGVLRRAPGPIPEIGRRFWAHFRVFRCASGFCAAFGGFFFGFLGFLMSHCHGAAWRVGQDVRLTAARSGFDPGDRRFLTHF